LHITVKYHKQAKVVQSLIRELWLERLPANTFYKFTLGVNVTKEVLLAVLPMRVGGTILLVMMLACAYNFLQTILPR
jgi:hypothetical protein